MDALPMDMRRLIADTRIAADFAELTSTAESLASEASRWRVPPGADFAVIKPAYRSCRYSALIVVKAEGAFFVHRRLRDTGTVTKAPVPMEGARAVRIAVNLATTQRSCKHRVQVAVGKWRGSTYGFRAACVRDTPVAITERVASLLT